MDGATINYATSKDWLDIMKNRSKVRMHELIERLGLRAKWSSNKRGKTNFESALVRELVADMGDVVATLPKEPDELMKFLSDDGSLKEEVDGMIEKHGAKIWGRVGDREHLITANEPGVEEGVYPRDLYFENEEDKALIHKLLHWWIGLKACNVILARERLDRERRKKAENRQARAEAEYSGQNEGNTPASFVALAPNSVLHDVDTGSRGSPMSSTAMLTPPESGESPVVGPREGAGFIAVNGGASGFTAGPSTHQAQPEQQPQSIVEGVWKRFASDVNGSREHSASWAPPQPAENKAAVQQQIATTNQAAVDRQISVEIARLVASFRSDDAASEEIPQPNSSVPYGGLDYDSLRALRQYIYGEESGIHFDEEALLNRLEKAWREGMRADYDKIVENIQVFVARERAFLTWIELKRHLAALERADKRTYTNLISRLRNAVETILIAILGWRTEGHTTAEIERRIQQHRTLMGATQTLMAAFEDIGQGFGLGPNVVIDRDELLRQAIVVLAGDKYAVEMQWQTIEFAGLVGWLGEHLEMFRKEEEEEGRGSLWYVS
ncbi:Nn.00g089620.m01.CDS01 [Neocucurbitaria sp. VM-36]